MVRNIERRKRRTFRENAKLLETATQYISMFSSQSEEGQKAAADIKLVGDEETPRPRRIEQPEEKKELILPSGYRQREEGRRGLSQTGRHVEATVEELPDDLTRNVIPDKTEAELAKPGSYEMLMKLGGKIESGR